MPNFYIRRPESGSIGNPQNDAFQSVDFVRKKFRRINFFHYTVSSLFVFLVLVLCAGKAGAQIYPRIQVQKTLGGVQDDYILKIFSSGGGYVLAGNSNSSAGGQKSQSAYGGSDDYWLVKVDASGTRIWDKRYGSNYQEYLYNAIATPDGGYLLIGEIGKTAGQLFYPADSASLHDITSSDKSAANESDGWVVKVDANGNKQWDKRLGSAANDIAYSATVTPDGGYLVLLTTTTAVASGDVTTPIHPGATANLWAVKLDAGGNKVWDRTYGSAAIETSPSVVATSDGNFAVAAETSSLVAGYDKSEPGRGINDIWVLKIDGAGNKLWDKTLGGSNFENVPKILEAPDGGLVIAAHSLSTGSGEHQSGNFGSNDIWLIKITANGNRVWDRNFGTNVFDRLNSFAAAPGGGYLIGTSGLINSSGNMTETSRGGADTWIIKVSEDGVLLWDKTLGGSSADGYQGSYYNFGAVLPLADGSTVAGISSASGISGDKTEANRGVAGTNYDIWLVKLSCAYGTDTVLNNLTPATQTTCIGSTPLPITGTDDDALFVDEITYLWQRSTNGVSGWATVSGATGKDYQPASGAAYYRRIALWSCHADTSNVAAVLQNANTAPTLNMGGLYYTCPGSAVQIGGNPVASGGAVPYTYSWDNASSLNNATIARPTATVSGTTAFTLTVTDANGCRVSDKAMVYVPAAALAGPDVSYCQGSAGIQIGADPLSAIPNATYTWTPATGLSSTAIARPVASPATTTNYTVSLSFLNSAGAACLMTDAVTVTPAAPPAPNFAGPDVAICSGGTANIGVGSVAGYTYTWSPGLYLVSNNTAQVTFNPGSRFPIAADPITYTVTATAGNCVFTDQTVVSVLKADAGPDGCGPRTIGTPDVTPNLNETYAWTKAPGSTGNGSIISGANAPQATVSATTTGTDIYRLTVTYAGVSCTDDVTVPVCGGCSTTFAEESGNCLIYSGKPMKLLADNGNTSGFSYSWSPAAGLSATSGSTVSVLDALPHTYTLTKTSITNPSLTCSFTKAVNAGAASFPSFSAPDVSACNGAAVTLGNSAVSGYTYAWTGPNGFSSTVSNPGITIGATTVGTYYVQVNDTDPGNTAGCFTRDTVIVTSTPVTITPGNNQAICNAGIVSLGVPGNSDTYLYSWTPAGANWQNGTNQNSKTPDVLVNATTTFNVTASNIYGCTSTGSVTVTVNNNPAIPNAPNVIVCPNSGTTIGSPAQAGVLYSWSPTTGLSDPAAAQPTVTVGNSGSPVTYTLTATFPGGCTATDQVTVTIANTSFNLGADISYCPSGGPVSIGANAPATGVASYSWTPSTGLSNATVANPTTNTTVPQTYILYVIYTNGCVGSDTIKVTPTSAPDAGLNRTICFGSSTVVGSSTNTGTVSWTGSGTAYLSSTTAAAPTFNSAGNAPAGTYTLALSRTVSGCTNTDTVVVTVAPQISVTPGLATLCRNGYAIMGVTAAAPYVYSWTPTTGLTNPGGASTGITLPNAGNYLYKLNVTDPNSGCNGNADYIVTVSSTSAPAVSVTSPTACLGSPVPLSATVTPAAGNYSYTWTPATGLSNPYIANPTASISTPAQYRLSVINNANGCVASAVSTVSIDPLTGEYISDVTGDNTNCAGAAVKLGVKTITGFSYTYQWQKYNTATGSWAPLSNGGLYSGVTTDSLSISNNATLNGAQFRVVVTTATCGNTDTGSIARLTVNYCQKSAIGDFVWNDLNHDGLQTAGEPGIAGVNVVLYKNGAAISSTVTDAYGKYRFDGLDALDVLGNTNNYQLKFTALPNYSFATQGSAGSNGAGSSTDSDPDAGGMTRNIVLNYAQNLLDVDAGLVFTASSAGSSIGDRVWSDADGDGQQIAGEPGVAGVSVTLYNATGSIIMATTTDANGNYLFNNLPNGTYTVGVTPLPGTRLTASTGTTPGNATTNSDVDPVTGRTSSITIAAAGTIITGIDAGFAPDPKSSLGDRVWKDLNNNGIQDAGEPGIAGITVSLMKETAPGSGFYSVFATAVTDAKGYYIFTGLDAANYRLTATLPAGFTLSPALAPGGSVTDLNNSDFTLSGGTPTSTIYALGINREYMGLDLGMYNTAANTGSIGDRVWRDLNLNGVQDAGEPGFSGITVSLLDAGGNPVNDPASGQPYVVQSGYDGSYLFSDLPDGSYKVKFSNLPTNTSFSPTGKGTAATDSDPDQVTGIAPAVTLAPGNRNITTVDAGIMPVQPTGLGSIGDRVWIDANNNGIQDAGEQGVADIAVTLYAANGTTVIKTTITDAQGRYIFDGLNAGSYVVGFSNLPFRYNLVTPNAGSDPLLDSDPATATGNTSVIVLAQGEKNASVDAGIYSTAGINSIGDFVWVDADADGVQDAGEAGMPGVTVNLIAAGTGKIISAVVTDMAGNYLFKNLPNGDYRIQVVPPSGFTIVPGQTSVTNNTNSDVDSSGYTSVVSLLGGNNYTTVDAAITTTRAALGDYVWYDANGNGLQDTGEPPVSGATVTLYDALNTVVSSAVTGADGRYLFSNLIPGSYSIGAGTLPAGAVFTTQTINTANGSDVSVTTGKTNAVTLAAGEVNMDIDAGIKPFVPGGISGLVWFDAVNDNMRDATEPFVPGVFVTLKNNTGNVVSVATTNGDGFYQFDNVLPASGYTVTFSSLPANMVFVAQTTGTSNGSDANPTTGIISSIAVTSGVMNRYNDAGLSINAASLPVVLERFTGRADNCIVTLDWEVGEERGISYYTVEHSSDGRHFTAIGSVPATGSQSKYRFTPDVHTPQSFYRLQMLQQDGTADVSNVVVLTVDCDNVQVGVYPNPAGSVLYINLSGVVNAGAAMYNTVGQDVLHMSLAGGVNEANISGLPAGIYTLRVDLGNGAVKNFIVTIQK